LFKYKARRVQPRKIFLNSEQFLNFPIENGNFEKLLKFLGQFLNKLLIFFKIFLAVLIGAAGPQIFLKKATRKKQTLKFELFFKKDLRKFFLAKNRHS